MSKNNAIQIFTEILEKAVEATADYVTFEHVSEGIEVFYMFGDTGFGAVLIDHELEGEVVGYIVEKAKLDKKPRGKMLMNLKGKQYTVFVKEYEHFGESAFEISLKRSD